MTSPSPFRRRALAAALACAALAAAIPAAPAVAGTTPSERAWVVVRKPALASYTPAAADQHNTAIGTITVTKIDPAEWSITIPNAAGYWTGNRGHFQATAMGSTPGVCGITGWNDSGFDIIVTVRCAGLAGNALITPFTLGYVFEQYDAGFNPTFGYAWLNAPGDVSSISDTLYQHVVAGGGTVTASRQSAGDHRLNFPGIQPATYVGVTPYDATTRCRIEGWFPDTGTSVDTFCGGASGVDTKATVYVARRTGPLGFGEIGATAWVADPTASSSRPPRAYRWSSSGKSPRITRSGPGVYTVRFPGLPNGGAAFVTAYGTSDRTCQVGSISKSTQIPTVGVRCFRGNGRPADSRFTIGWAG